MVSLLKPLYYNESAKYVMMSATMSMAEYTSEIYLKSSVGNWMPWYQRMFWDLGLENTLQRSSKGGSTNSILGNWRTMDMAWRVYQMPKHPGWIKRWQIFRATFMNAFRCQCQWKFEREARINLPSNHGQQPRSTAVNIDQLDTGVFQVVKNPSK
jgi:hypothetical protein